MSLRFIFNVYSHLRLGVPDFPSFEDFLLRFYIHFFPLRTSRLALHVCLILHKGKMVLFGNRGNVRLPFAELPLSF